MNSASLCSLAGRYESPIPPRCPAPTDCPKIPALHSHLYHQFVSSRNCHAWTCPLPPPPPPPDLALLMAFQDTCEYRRGRGGGQGKNPEQTKKSKDTAGAFILAYTKILLGCFLATAFCQKESIIGFKFGRYVLFLLF